MLLTNQVFGNICAAVASGRKPSEVFAHYGIPESSFIYFAVANDCMHLWKNAKAEWYRYRDKVAADQIKKNLKLPDSAVVVRDRPKVVRPKKSVGRPKKQTSSLPIERKKAPLKQEKIFDARDEKKVRLAYEKLEELVNTGATCRQAALALGIPPTSAVQYLKRKKYGMSVKPVSVPRIPDEVKAEVAKEIEAGVGNTEISRRLPVSIPVIQRIRRKLAGK